MTLNQFGLNQNFAGATVLAGRGKLRGTDRGLDGLVGLVILIATILIGFEALYALYVAGVSATGSSSSTDELEFGFGLAVVGSLVSVSITTLVYLVRLIVGRRSWPAALWGLILMTVFVIAGYAIMAGAVG